MIERMKGEKGVMNIGPDAREIIKNRSRIKNEVAARTPKEIMDLKQTNPIEYLRQRWAWVDKELHRMGHKDATGMWNPEHLSSRDFETFDRIMGKKPMKDLIK